MPSLDKKESWVLGTCTVTGTNTVSLVTFRKSVRQPNFIWSRTRRAVTTASRSLNFTGGGCCTLANSSRRLNSFRLAGVPPIEVGRFVPSERVKRSAFEASPCCSSKLKPAPGTCSSASFSEGSDVRWYSPELVGSTNSRMMFFPTPSRYRQRQVSNGYVLVEPPPSSMGRSYVPPVGC